jgi:enoyl-CoA hydratase/carnithine racemase
MSDITTKTQGAWGIIELTRPKALNSLTKDMCERMGAALADWAADDAVAAILVRGEGDRAFCAGGDIRWLYDTGREDPEAAASFFRSEYRMNAQIAALQKPYVALMDGVCMGGGVGISMNASHRIVTERTMWAMPECAIGLIPDVGATYLLPRLPGGLGAYLGLTGRRLTGADCLIAEIATHVVPSTEMETLGERLLELSFETDPKAAIDQVLSDLADPQPGELASALPDIDRFFGRVDSIEGLLTDLEREGGAFGQQSLEQMAPASPTSLKLTRHALATAPSSFDDCIRREFNVTANILRNHDLYEGVRAQIIDKDRSPKWSPATLDAVDEATIKAYFDAPPDGPLVL